jgi:hypothetical protein
MTVYNDLINLFAEHAVSEIEGNNGKILTDCFGVATVEDLTKISGYTDNFTLVRECKVDLEKILARKLLSAAEQVTACLESLYAYKEAGRADRTQEDRPSPTETFRELIKRSVYDTAWSAEECETFDGKYKVIMDWRHFFLSYTNRDAKTTNDTFRELIESAYSLDEIVTQWTTENFVAGAVAKFLKKQNVSGFFDRNDIKSGDEIASEIRKYCGQCWAFVQIMEEETLVIPPAGKLNWCFEEYDEFHSAASHLQALLGHDQGKRYHFVSTVEPIQDLEPANLGQYSAWFKHAERLHYEGLLNKEPKEVRKTVKQIATEVVKLRKSVINDLLR